VTYSLESDSQRIRSYQWFELHVPVSRVLSCDPRNSDIEMTPPPTHINLDDPNFCRLPFLNPVTDHVGNITHYLRHEGVSWLDFQRDGVSLGKFTPRDLYHEIVQSVVHPDVNDVIYDPVPESQPLIGAESVLGNESCLYHSVLHLLRKANTPGNPFHGSIGFALGVTRISVVCHNTRWNQPQSPGISEKCTLNSISESDVRKSSVLHPPPVFLMHSCHNLVLTPDTLQVTLVTGHLQRDL